MVKYISRYGILEHGATRCKPSNMQLWVNHLIRKASFVPSKVYFANTKCKEDTCDPGYKCIQDSIFSSACQECDDGFVGIGCKYKNCESDPDKCKNGGICYDKTPDNWLPDVDPAYCQCPDPLFVGFGSFSGRRKFRPDLPVFLNWLFWSR